MDQNICLVILIGLPASGKTTFANLFSSNVMGTSSSDSQYNIIHVCYDELIPLEDPSVSWKDVRKNLINRVSELVSSSLATVPAQTTEGCQDVRIRNGNSRKTLILVDDNMYYRSMRYEFYQLARVHNLSFCQLYFECSLETALENNSKREGKSQVLNDVIVRMSVKLEPPDAGCNSWERFSMTLPSCKYNTEVQRSVLQLIDNALAERVMPRKCASFEDSEASRARCSISMLHQVDILSRKLVGQIMAQKCKEALSRQELSKISVQLNSKRQSLFNKIKAGEINFFEQVDCQIFGQISVPENILQDWVTKVFDSV